MNEDVVTSNGAPPLQMQVASSANHVAQTTAIEQSRASAEVQSAMVVAQRFPRDERHALARIKLACGRKGLADRAFYSYPRGGTTVSDASIYFAREIARCWGNVQYEIVELAQDTDRGESEVMAYAWDLETNVRAAIRFIVPHVRQTKTGGKRLTDPRDIYEMVANMGARRLRNCILSIVPDDVIQDAKAMCRKTLENGESAPLADRIRTCVESFAGFDVTRRHLEDHLGIAPEKMTLDQLTDLQIIYGTIKGGEQASSFFDLRAKLGEPDNSNAAAIEKPKEQTDEKPAAPKPEDKPKRGRPKKEDLEQAKAAGVRSFEDGRAREDIPEKFTTPSLKVAFEEGWDEVRAEQMAETGKETEAENSPPLADPDAGPGKPEDGPASDFDFEDE
jgi:hypothetical protein